MSFDYGATQSIGASGTSLFTDQQIPNGLVRRLLTENTGANNGLNTSTVGIASLIVELGGIAIVNATALMWRALLECIGGPANFTPSTELRWPVPLNLDGRGGYRYDIGIPAGQKVSYKILTNSDGSSGTSTLGWEVSPSPVRFLPRFVGVAAGWGASSNNQRVTFNKPTETVYGVSVPMLASNGLTRVKLVLQGIPIWNFSILQARAYSSLTSPTSITSSLFLRVPEDLLGLRATPGDSYLEADTGSSSAAGDQVALYTLEQVAP